MIGRRLRSAMTGAALLGTALLGTTLATAPAQASAYDCASWSASKAPAAGPFGDYCFGFDGSGQQVTDTYGKYYFTSITLHAALYHEREVVRFYDNKNANYATFWESAFPGWRYGNVNWTTDIHGTVRPGRLCGSLRANGRVLATVCEALP